MTILNQILTLSLYRSDYSIPKKQLYPVAQWEDSVPLRELLTISPTLSIANCYCFWLNIMFTLYA